MRGVLRFRVGRTPVAVQPWFWVTAVLLGLGSRSLLAFVLCILMMWIFPATVLFLPNAMLG